MAYATRVEFSHENRILGSMESEFVFQNVQLKPCKLTTCADVLRNGICNNSFQFMGMKPLYFVIP